MRRLFAVGTVRSKVLLAAGILLLPTTSLPAPPAKLSGSIIGFISDASGTPQMGAAVLLYNRIDRLSQRVVSDAQGRFSFDSLAAERYSVRISLSSFLPVLRENVTVQPGMESLLAIQLSGILSSIQLVRTVPIGGSLMSDDWKWALRGNLATRSILRFQQQEEKLAAEAKRESHASPVFSDTRGLVKVSAGGSPLMDSEESDLGTTFSLATSLYGANNLQFSGNFGYSYHSGVPTAGFRTSYSHGEPGQTGPEISVTMRQVMLPDRFSGPLVSGGRTGIPQLRSLSMGTVDRLDLMEGLKLEYGGSLDTIQATDRITYFSPFARLTYLAGKDSAIRFAYSSGSAPTELIAPTASSEIGLQQDVLALSAFPRVTLRDGEMRVQRSSTYELGYSQRLGSRVYQATMYRERVANAGLLVSASEEFSLPGDLLADVSSRNGIFNIGSYENTGYMAAVTQEFGEPLAVTVAAGSGSGLRADDRAITDETPADDLRGGIQSTRRPWIMGKLAGTLPVIATHYVASYEWTDYRTLTPNHTFLTQQIRPEAGLNVYLRQPIPGFLGLPGRLEISADLRNLLAQGYLPMSRLDGRQVLLIQSPRMFRGGVSFIF